MNGPQCCFFAKKTIFFDAHRRRWEVVVFHLVVGFTLPPIIMEVDNGFLRWFSTSMIMDIMGERLPFLLLASCYLGLGALFLTFWLSHPSFFSACVSLCALLFHLP